MTSEVKLRCAQEITKHLGCQYICIWIKEQVCKYLFLIVFLYSLVNTNSLSGGKLRFLQTILLPLLEIYFSTIVWSETIAKCDFYKRHTKLTWYGEGRRPLKVGPRFFHHLLQLVSTSITAVLNMVTASTPRKCFLHFSLLSLKFQGEF